VKCLPSSALPFSERGDHVTAFFRTAMSTLPLELLHHICDIVAESEDHTALKSYALMCHGIVRHCQRHLFSKVTLSFRGDRGPCSVQRLKDVMEDNATLGSYIKSLSVFFAHKRDYSDKSLPLILSKCTKVSSFRLQTFLSMMYPANGHLPASFPGDTRAAVEAIVYSPLLTQLAIVGFYFSVSTFFARCSASLTKVEITGKAMGASVSDYHGTVGPPIFLRQIKASPETMSCLLGAKHWQSGRSIFDFSKLRDISARSHWQKRGYIENINEVLLHGAPVERLSLQLGGKHSYMTPSVSF